MTVSLQMFGSISLPSGDLNVMLCRDSDKLSEVMIHWFGHGVPNRAGLFELVPDGDFRYRAVLKSLFDSSDIGALIAAPFKSFTEAQRYSVVLVDNGNGFAGTWNAPGGDAGNIQLFPAVEPTKDGLKVTTCRTWADFKDWATRIRARTRDPAFRGHGWNQWPLQTTSFRAGITRLERYYEQTLLQFKHHAEATMNIAFNLSNGDDYATLLGLAQHHGLPTPLLDFTSSPYVAAYFAFADAVENRRDAEGFVRVYALDGEFLSYFAPATVPIATVSPYLASLTISARHNPRLYAQQGKFLVTNIGKLETHLLLLAKNSPVKKEFLYVADVPIKCAVEALTDLKYMGLTAATLFPGLDGVCKMMRQEIMLRSQDRSVELLPDLGASLVEQPG